VQGFGGKPPDALEGLYRSTPAADGFTGFWGVACPKCSRFDFMGMRTKGLPDLDSAWRRQAQLENDLQATCPHYHSALLMPTESAMKQLVGVC
jgi:hypothetical protein